MPNPFAPHHPGSTRFVGPAAVLSDDDMNTAETGQIVTSQSYGSVDLDPYPSDRVFAGPVLSEDVPHGEGDQHPGGTPSGLIFVPAGYTELHVITRTNVLPEDGTLWGHVHVNGPSEDYVDPIPRTINGMQYQDHAFLVSEGVTHTVYLSAETSSGAMPHGIRYLSEFYVEALGPGPDTVTPIAPHFVDASGTDFDIYEIPDVVGVQYSVTGIGPVATGAYPGSGTVTVTAAAKEGYTLTPGSTTSWTFTYTTITGQQGETRRTFYRR